MFVGTVWSENGEQEYLCQVGFLLANLACWLDIVFLGSICAGISWQVENLFLTGVYITITHRGFIDSCL